MKLLLTTVAIVGLIDFVRCETCDKTYNVGKIKFCDSDSGTEPISCVPNAGKAEKEIEIKPGQQWSNGAFQFECKKTGPSSLAFQIIACLLPGGQLLNIGSEAGDSSKGLYYKCIGGANGTVTRTTVGCFFNNQKYTTEQTLQFNGASIKCAKNGKGGYEAKLAGCVFGSNVVPLGAAHKEGKTFFKCEANGQNSWQINKVSISESEYIKWQQAFGGDEEEQAAGDSGSGYVHEKPIGRPPSFEAIPEPPPPYSPPAPHLPLPTPPKPTLAQPQCKDSLPICKTLCERSCRTSSFSSSSASAFMQEEAVGLAVPGRKRKFGKNSFTTGHSSHHQAKHGFMGFGGKSGGKSGSAGFGFGFGSLGGALGLNAVAKGHGHGSGEKGGCPICGSVGGGGGGALDFGGFHVVQISGSSGGKPHKPSVAINQASSSVSASAITKLVSSSYELINALCPESCGQCLGADLQIDRNYELLAKTFVDATCSIQRSPLQFDGPVGYTPVSKKQVLGRG